MACLLGLTWPGQKGTHRWCH